MSIAEAAASRTPITPSPHETSAIVVRSGDSIELGTCRRAPLGTFRLVVVRPHPLFPVGCSCERDLSEALTRRTGCSTPSAVSWISALASRAVSAWWHLSARFSSSTDSSSTKGGTRPLQRRARSTRARPSRWRAATMRLRTRTTPKPSTCRCHQAQARSSKARRSPSSAGRPPEAARLHGHVPAAGCSPVVLIDDHHPRGTRPPAGRLRRPHRTCPRRRTPVIS